MKQIAKKQNEKKEEKINKRFPMIFMEKRAFLTVFAVLLFFASVNSVSALSSLLYYTNPTGDGLSIQTSSFVFAQALPDNALIPVNGFNVLTQNYFLTSIVFTPQCSNIITVGYGIGAINKLNSKIVGITYYNTTTMGAGPTTFYFPNIFISQLSSNFQYVFFINSTGSTPSTSCTTFTTTTCDRNFFFIDICHVHVTPYFRYSTGYPQYSGIQLSSTNKILNWGSVASIDDINVYTSTSGYADTNLTFNMSRIPNPSNAPPISSLFPYSEFQIWGYYPTNGTVTVNNQTGLPDVNGTTIINFTSNATASSACTACIGGHAGLSEKNCNDLGCLVEYGYCVQGPYSYLDFNTCDWSKGWVVNMTPQGVNCQDLKCDPTACPTKCSGRSDSICACIANTSAYGSAYGTYQCGTTQNSLCLGNACVDSSNNTGATCSGRPFLTPFALTIFNYSLTYGNGVPTGPTSSSRLTVTETLYSYQTILVVLLFMASVGIFYYTGEETIPMIILIAGNFLLALFNIFNPAMEGYLIAIMGLEVLFYYLQEKGTVQKA